MEFSLTIFTLNIFSAEKGFFEIISNFANFLDMLEVKGLHNKQEGSALSLRNGNLHRIGTGEQKN